MLCDRPWETLPKPKRGWKRGADEVYSLQQFREDAREKVRRKHTEKRWPLENSIGIERGKNQKFDIPGPGTTLFDPGFGFLASRCKFSIMKRPNRTNMEPFPAIFSQ